MKQPGDDTLIPPQQAGRRDPWVDIGLALEAYPPAAEVYAHLLRHTGELRERRLADACFFIHKPPGIRWRLHSPRSSSTADLRRAAASSAARIVGAERVRCAVYEPQQALFGGPRSMGYVHRSWDADSQLWLGAHARSARPLPLSARVDLSFRVLSYVFGALGVVGWEDREVWEHVTVDTGRRLAEHEWRRPEVTALAARLAGSWAAVWPAVAQRRPAAGPPPDPLLREFADSGGEALAGWYEECLSRPGTRHLLTPRRAAAYWTVFHWNRTGLPAAHQALIAQTLAGPPPVRAEAM